MVLQSSVDNTGFITTIELKPKHIIYQGHFPGHPVTPGVIQLQIVHELLEKHLDKELKLISVAQCKFLKILDPIETPQLFIHARLNRVNEFLNVKARGENETGVFFKLDSVYQVSN